MTSYTVRNVNNVCKAFEIEGNNLGRMVCRERGQVIVNGKTYTVQRRPTDNKCCIYRVPGVGDGDELPLELILEEGDVI